MRRLLGLVALITLTFTVLLLTGIIDETYLLAYFASSAISPDISAAALARIINSFKNEDWWNLRSGILALKSSVVDPLLKLYFFRSLLYLVAAILVILWAVPFVRRAFAALRILEPEVDLSSLDEEARRSHAVFALRTRAARKRIESYAFLAAALVSLALAIGFVTRDHGYEEPQVLAASDATSMDAAVQTPKDILDAAQGALNENLETLIRLEEQLVLVTENAASKANEPPLSKGGNAEPPSQAAIAALLARQPLDKLAMSSVHVDVAKDYLAFGKAQIAMIDRQAEIATWNMTILVVATKAAAVILVLALITVLVKLYQRGLYLSVQYDGIADAVQLGNVTLDGDLVQLRAGLTPFESPTDNVEVPKNILDAFIQRFVTKKVKNEPGLLE